MKDFSFVLSKSKLLIYAYSVQTQCWTFFYQNKATDAQFTWQPGRYE